MNMLAKYEKLYLKRFFISDERLSESEYKTNLLSQEKLSTYVNKFKAMFNIVAISVIVTDLETNVTTTYASINETAKALGCRSCSISSYIRRETPNLKKKSYKGRYVIRSNNEN